MKKYLFIDDLRIPNITAFDYEVFLARSYKEAIKALKQYKFDIIDFDHDLGEDKTGYDIAKYIIENQIIITDGFIIHSMNPVGVNNIKQLLTHFNYNYIYRIN